MKGIQAFAALPVGRTVTFADPAVQAAEATEKIQHPVAGTLTLLRFPLELSTGRAGARRLPPRAGEHTDEILRETGFEEPEIAQLRADGAISGRERPWDSD